jgi:hypothetical protein
MHLSSTRGINRRTVVQAGPGKTLFKKKKNKNPKTKRAGSVIQVAEGLSSQCEALNSNPNTTKQTNKNRKKAILHCE